MLTCHTADDELDHALRLLQLRGRRGPLREALRAAGGWTAWRQRQSASLIPGPAAGASVPTDQMAALASPAPGELRLRVRHWLRAEPRRALLAFGDPAYPEALLDSPGPPLLLFAEGDLALAQSPAMAVVGSRTPTPMGREIAAEFARDFAAAGLCVASGLAAGIDAAAHQAALPLAGRTLAVLGCGPDIAFPSGNARLMQAIAADGLVLSEHPPGVQPRPSHFPSRNRIVAALGLATVVIEARLRSGALISARLAAEAGRDVFAVPGSVRNPAAEGCHRLIRDGAGLATCAADVMAALAPTLRARLTLRPAAASDRGLAIQPPDHWPTDHKRLWSALGDDPTPMDELIARSGLTFPQIGPILGWMELEGRVENHFGQYRRKPPDRV